MRLLLVLAAAAAPVFALGLSGGSPAQDAPASLIPGSLIPGPKNFEAWAEFIRPNGDELTFEQVGWRNEFWPAIEEARELGRPVLLWTMNGHPLGCT